MDKNHTIDLNKPVLWSEHEFNADAYNKGLSALKTDKNPYPCNSSNWFSWNKGKNTKDWDQIKR